MTGTSFGIIEQHGHIETFKYVLIKKGGMADEHGHVEQAHGDDGHAPAGGGLNLFGFKKKEEHTPVDPKAPIPIHHPKAPPYDSNFGELYKTRIKYKGLYDLDGLYRFMANWLRQRRYELNETLYKSKPPEMELRWTAERKKTGFVMEVITIYYHSWGEYDLDVVVNGKKKKMTNARFILTIGGKMEAPYADIFGRERWTHNAVERRLLLLFTNWFAKRELESVYWDALYYEMYKFQGEIKDFLKLEAKGNVY